MGQFAPVCISVNFVAVYAGVLGQKDNFSVYPTLPIYLTLLIFGRVPLPMKMPRKRQLRA